MSTSTFSSNARSLSASSTGNTTQQKLVEERLSTMLSAPKDANTFSVADYLNVALESSIDNEHDLQQRMAELALQLQLHTQTCHEDIGRIGAELQAILPRCHADVGRIGVGLQGLQQDAQTLMEATTTAAQGTATKRNAAAKSKNTSNDNNNNQSVSSSLETLSTLHALQANLKRTHEILTAAATWDSTLAEIPPLLAPAQSSSGQGDTSSSSSNTTSMASNLPQAVQKLALLEKGEKALRGMPHPEERKAQLTKLRQQISHLLQPQLTHALQHMSSRLGPLQQCVSLYAQLDMLDNLLQRYVHTRPTALHKAWFDYTPPPASSPDRNDVAFAEWLPTWFESVLQLLQEERRQASSVFGPAQVPTILALVLQETFRPILPSFASRFAAGGNNDTNHLTLVCTIYQSTLQFLSLAYETVASCWLDVMENTSNGSDGKPKDGVSMYRQMTGIFQQIIAPFSKYQTSLAKLEQTRALQEYNTPFASMIQNAMPSASMELEDLSKATDGLFIVTQEQVVPTAQAMMNRFEFLQGGYHATAIVDTMDEELVRRIRLVMSSLQKVSTSMDWATNFDEPHVLAALQVLKIAATCQNAIGQLQGTMRQQFLVLRDRMASVLAREKEVTESRSFMIPDSLSPVEINALLCFQLFQKNDEAAPSVLARLGGGADADASGAALLVQTQAAAAELATTCHKFVFQACYSVPQKHLKDMASMPSWKSSSDATADSYGTLPQAYITQVGEHMLALVQALEPFASDRESLTLANQVMDNIRQVAEEFWRDFLNVCGGQSSSPDKTKSLIHKFMKADDEILDYVVGGEDAVLEDEEDDGEGGEDKEVAAFCNAWLDAVGLAVTGRLLERILSIPTLSAKGCEHLNVDLSYLQNVLVALGVSGHPHPLLGHVAQLVTLDNGMLAERLRTLDNTNDLQTTLINMEERLAAMKSGS